MNVFFDFTNDASQRAFLIDHALVLLERDLPVLWIDGSIVNLTLSAQPMTEYLFATFFHRSYAKLWNKTSTKNRNFTFHRISQDEFRNAIANESRDIPNLDDIISQQIVTYLRDSSPCPSHTTSLFRKFQNLANKVDYSVRKILTTYPITDVYVYNGRFLPDSIVASRAKKRNLNVRYIETFASDWKDRYWIFQSPVHSSDYRSEIMFQYAESVSSERLFDVSLDWFTDRKFGKSQNFTSRMKGEYRGSLNEAQKLIVFFHSSEDELITTNLAKSAWENQFKAIESLKEIVDRNSDWKLVVRVHPNLSTKSRQERKKWSFFGQKLSSESVEFIPFDSTINSYDLLSYAAIVVTFGSTIGVEAVLAGKLSLLMSNAFHEPMGICRVVDNQEEIENLIQSVSIQSQVPSIDSVRSAQIYAFFMANAGIRLSKVRHFITDSILSREVLAVQDIEIVKPKSYALIRRLEGYIRNEISSPYSCRC
jgi:hypothetical protein